MEQSQIVRQILCDIRVEPPNRIAGTLAIFS